MEREAGSLQVPGYVLQMRYVIRLVRRMLLVVLLLLPLLLLLLLLLLRKAVDQNFPH